jgi:hypothetical protein
LAKRALAEAGITEPAVDLDDLALARTLRIERHAHLGPTVRAAYEETLGLIRVIDLPPTVERFPIAHEMGHAILGDGGAECTQAMIREKTDPTSLAEMLEGFDPEATASAIAGQLLVPSEWLRPAVIAGHSVNELRDMFDVTSAVLTIAILRDGLLSRLRTS